jgi:excisionase family DNA binding protein
MSDGLAPAPVPASTPGPSSPEYFTPDQVAELLQVSTKSVYRWAAEDPTMPALRIGGTVRFHAERLRRWLRDREQGARRMRSQVRALPKPAPSQEAAER